LRADIFHASHERYARTSLKQSYCHINKIDHEKYFKAPIGIHLQLNFACFVRALRMHRQDTPDSHEA